MKRLLPILSFLVFSGIAHADPKLVNSPVDVRDGSLAGHHFGSQSANQILASPDGTAGLPTFRSIVAGDLPATLTSNARVKVSKSGTPVGTRREINFIPGSNVTLTVTDDPSNEKVDVTIAASAGGGGGGGGTVTSVDLTAPAEFSVSGNPITGAGTLGVAWASQTTNKVLASPNGSTGAPTFRSLAAADIPNLDTAKVTSGTFAVARLPSLAGDVTGAIDTNTVTKIRGKSIATPTITENGKAITWDNTGGAFAYTTLPTGTVTSVALSLPSIFSVTGSPVTSSGTLTGSLASQSANTVFAGPSSGSAAPTFRALVAGDIPSLDAAKINSGTFAAARIPNAAGDVSGAYSALSVDKAKGIPLPSPLMADDGKVLKYDNASTSYVLGSVGAGTVTSVGLSMPSWLSVTGSPVTSSGTLTVLAATGQTANRFLATPDGTTGAVGLRAIVLADLPTSLLTTSSISGTVGTLSKFTGTNSLGDSILSESGSMLTVNGNITMGTGTGSPNVTLSGGSGGNRDLVYSTGGSSRWLLRADSATESGSNAGSNFALVSRDDMGVFLANALTVQRSNSAATFAGPITLSTIGSGSGNSVLTESTGLIGKRTIDARVWGSSLIDSSDSRLTDSRTPTGTAGGDLSGTYPNPTVQKIRGKSIATPTLTENGKAVTWDNTGGTFVYTSLPAGTVTGTGTTNTLTKFTGAGAIGDSLVSESGSTVTVNGNVVTGLGSGSTNVTLNGGSGGNRDFIFSTGGSFRWLFRADSAAESGSNAGSNLAIVSRDDSGAFLANAVTIQRSNSAVTLAGPLTVSTIGSGSGNSVLTESTGLFGKRTIDSRVWGSSLIDSTDSRLTDSRTPTGSAGGDLTGTYPNPTIATNAVTTAKINALAVTDAKINDVAWTKITGTRSTTDLTEGTNLFYTDERVDDRAAALIQNGTGLTWTYNDVANTLTGNVSLSPFSTTNLTEGSNLYYTTERAQDSVGAALTDTSTVDFTYDDPGNAISAVVLPGGINHNSLAGLTTGDPHTQYALLAGRTGGQTLIGGTAPSNSLTLQSTSDVTRGNVAVADTLKLFSLASGSTDSVLIESTGTVQKRTIDTRVWGSSLIDSSDSRLTDSRTPTGTAGGDLTGTYPNPTVAKIRGKSIATPTVSENGKAITWDNTAGTFVYTALGGSGTVTSVGLTVPSWLSVSGSPVTASGTLGVTATTGQTANQVLATPNGSTGAVGLRALVLADLPTSLLTTSNVSGTVGTLSKFTGTNTLGNSILSESGSMLTANGNMTLGTGTGSPNVTLSGGSGGNRDFVFSTGSISRWLLRTDSTAESGSNAGSNFALVSRDDLGNLLANALTIQRSNSATTLAGALTLSTIGAGSGNSVLTESTGLIGKRTIDARVWGSSLIDSSDSRLTDSRNPTGSAGGDLSGTYPNPTVQKIQGKGIASPTVTENGKAVTWDNTGGTFVYTSLPTGTVTSVALTTPSWLTVGGSPVTGSGTLAVTATTGLAANQVLATPNGSTGALAPRALVAADIPTISGSQVSGNISGNAANVTGIVAIVNGGTAATSALAGFNNLSPMTTLGDMIYGGTSGTGTRLAGNTTATKKVLAQTGTGSVSAAPAWSTLSISDISGAVGGSGTTGTLPKFTGSTTLGDSLLSESGSMMTVNGNLTLGTGSGSPNVTLSGGSGGNRDLVYSTGASSRWLLRTDSTLESGSNAGSNFAIVSRDDSGVFLANALTIQRSNSATTLAGALTLSTLGAGSGNSVLTEASGLVGKRTIDSRVWGSSLVDITDSRLTDSRTPTGSAGGDLTGTYPNPTIATNAVTTAKLNALAVTDAKIADVAWSKITGLPSSFTPSLHASTHAAGGTDALAWGTIHGSGLNAARPTAASTNSGYLWLSTDVNGGTLYRSTGLAWVQVAQGVTESGPPSGSAGGDLTGTYPNPTLVTAGTAGTYAYPSSLTTDSKGRVTSVTGGSAPPPVSATYITQTPDGTLSNEQALSALATGLLKNTTTTGVLSIATAGTDYVPPSGTGATGTWGISISGNAATATNGVVTTGTYSNPSWLTALDGDKLMGMTANKILKSDGSGNLAYAVAGTDYLTSYTETDTLPAVTARGAITTDAIGVGGLTVTNTTTNAFSGMAAVKTSAASTRAGMVNNSSGLFSVNLAQGSLSSNWTIDSSATGGMGMFIDNSAPLISWKYLGTGSSPGTPTNLASLDNAGTFTATDLVSTTASVNTLAYFNGSKALRSATLGSELTLSSGSLSLTNTAVSSGSYTYASITVNSKGQLTAASNGTTPESPLTFSPPFSRSVNTISLTGRVAASNLPTGSTGTVLTGQGASDPSFSATPTVTGITANGTSDALAATGTPSGSATAALVRLGGAPVGGSANGQYLNVNAVSGFTGYLIKTQVNGGTDAFTVDYQGRIGMGTAPGTHGIDLLTTTLTANGTAGIGVRNQSVIASGNTGYGAIIQKTGTSLGTHIAGYFSATGGANNYGIVVPNGSVGIGNTAPTATLDVTGTAKLSSTLTMSALTGSASTNIGYLGIDGSHNVVIKDTPLTSDVYVDTAGDTMTGTLNSRSVIPTTNSTYTSGDSSHWWIQTWSTALETGSIDLYQGGVSQANITVLSGPKLQILNNGNIDINASTGTVHLIGTTKVDNLNWAGVTGTTVGAAGGASALPATPAGYLSIVIGVSTVKIPYYN